MGSLLSTSGLDHTTNALDVTIALMLFAPDAMFAQLFSLSLVRLTASSLSTFDAAGTFCSVIMAGLETVVDRTTDARDGLTILFVSAGMPVGTINPVEDSGLIGKLLLCRQHDFNKQPNRLLDRFSNQCLQTK